MIHKLDATPGYTISSRGMWLPGIYATTRAAQFAFQFPIDVLQALSDRICGADGEFRLITTYDLVAARPAGKGAEPPAAGGS